ncbi:MAG: radical SAM protein [Saprospiraceae bacterium]
MENETVVSIAPPSQVFRVVSNDLHPEAANSSQHIVSGLRKEVIEILIRIEIVGLILKHFRNPFKWYKIFKALDPHRKNILGDRRIEKIAKVDGKYYWGLFIPGWPSVAFHNFLKAEINRNYPMPVKTNRFTNIFVAITNKCPLACEHCYEWDALNKKEKLTLPELKTIVQKFQNKGVSQIHISGGEPLVRMHDVLELLQSSGKETDFWILTSGFNLTIENALKLKNSGLAGVMISLDHFEPEVHNLFRGFKDSFQWVEKAVRNSIAANLVTTLSICVTKSFVSEVNLMKYMELAKKMGVSFVQILEPRAVGHYRGQNVDLNREQEKIVEEFYLKVNYDAQYKTYPVICYHGYHQRRMGCLASGDRSLYIDTVGDIHACPFCQSKTGNALDDDIDHAIEVLQSAGCHKF